VAQEYCRSRPHETVNGMTPEIIGANEANRDRKISDNVFGNPGPLTAERNTSARSTAANFAGSSNHIPRKPNTLFALGIPNPPLHNPLNSFANTRTRP